MKTILKIGSFGVMIVCVCRGVSEREVVEAVRHGARTADEIGRRCGGAGGDCGTCRPHIEDCLAAHGSRAA